LPFLYLLHKNKIFNKKYCKILCNVLIYTCKEQKHKRKEVTGWN
jgi:hypothetical protein